MLSFIRSFTGRLLIGAIFIHAVMLPALFGGILYIAKQEFETQFVQNIRSFAFSVSQHISITPREEHVRAQLEEALLSGQMVFARADFKTHEITVKSDDFQVPATFVEDYGVGENNDAFYYIISPLINEAGEHIGQLQLAYDETPLQKHFATINQRGVYVAAAYFLVTIALIAIIGPRLTAMQRRLIHQSRHDTLTDLPNRLHFNEWLEQEIDIGRRKNRHFSLVMLDIKRLEHINDALGHDVGDAVLIETAQRFKEGMTKSFHLARLGSDEFAILLPGVKAHRAVMLAKHLLGLLDQEFKVGDQALHLGANLGIVEFPFHGLAAQDLLRRANIAMNHAKHSHTDWCLFDPDFDKHTLRQLTLSNQLKAAMENHELVPYYQPKLDLENGRINSAEVLVRWQHPELGILGPDEFISLAEQVGQIDPLTLYILDAAVRQCSLWRNQGWRDFSVAVNLSAWNLQDNALPEKIFSILDRYQLPASCLQLELTESAIYSDMGQAQKILDRIHGAGIALAIDDFGTGYSSLTHLRDLPVSYFKIDKSFVMDMEHKANDAAIVKSSLDLAKNLGLTSVAEGVEHESTLNLLKTLGCDSVQGYFIQRPLPAAEFEAWYGERQGNSGFQAQLVPVPGQQKSP